MDRGAWRATAHGGHKELDTTERLTLSHFQREQGKNERSIVCLALEGNTPLLGDSNCSLTMICLKKKKSLPQGFHLNIPGRSDDGIVLVRVFQRKRTDWVCIYVKRHLL